MDRRLINKPTKWKFLGIKETNKSEIVMKMLIDCEIKRAAC